MKKILPIFLGVILCSACSIKDSYVEYTPQIAVSNYFYIINADSSTKDSLACVYNKELESYAVDTCQVGDSLVFMIGLYGIANDLISFNFTWDTTSIKMMSLSELIAPELIESQMISAGEAQFNFRAGLLALALPVGYKVKNSGLPEFRLTLATESQYSPAIASFKQIIEPEP